MRRAWCRALGLSIGQGSAVHLGCYVWFNSPGHLASAGFRIGDHSIINRDCCLDAREPLAIGDNVSTSPEVAINTTQHDWLEPGFVLQSRPVVVDDRAWSGMRATMLPGTRMCRGAIAAAGVVVNGDVPPMSVVAGNPARVVGMRPEAALRYSLNDLAPMFE